MATLLAPHTTVDGDEQPGSELSMDNRFEILKNDRRRIVLKYLEEHDTPVSLSTLADHVTAVENDTDVASITSSERKRVYVGLYQFHLPKMDRMGVIAYDQERGQIALTERGSLLYTSHEDRTTEDRRLDRVSLAIVAVGLLGIFGSFLTQQWLLATAVLSIQTLLLAVKTGLQSRTA